MRYPLVLALLGSWLVAIGAAHAESSSGGSKSKKWEITLTPYVWATGLKGRTATLPPLPATTIDVTFGDVLKNLEGSFMMTGEVRRGRYAVFFDFVYAKLAAEGPTPLGILFSGVEMQTSSRILTIGPSYRIVSNNTYTVDLKAGARVFSVDTKLTLKGGILPTVSKKHSETWADPIIGASGKIKLGRGFSLAGGGFVGGFGVSSNLTWDVYGGVGYQHRDWIAGFVGYRHLEVDYSRRGFVYDVSQSGPIVGIVFRF